MIGTQLGPYEIAEEIGAGGMATVYRAYQPAMDRYVAIKVIRSHILSDPVLRDRFGREARLIAKLEHPHLLPVYDFDGSADPPHIVMRFLEGGTLREVLSAGSLPQAEMIYMLRQVASALDYAHRQGVVHRDLKPSNIMIDREGNAFIADFGIARSVESGQDLTGTGVLVGTPAYMAPEQARGDADVDHRADLYALGVTIFEMLAGQPPFVRDSSLGVLMAHAQEPCPSVRSIKRALPASIDAVMARAMSKDPAERYATASDLVAAVAGALAVEPPSKPSQLQAMTETIAVDRHEALRQAPPNATDTDTPTDQQRQMTAIYLDVTELAEILYESGAETENVRAATDNLWKRFAAIAAEHGGVIQSRTDEVGIALWGVERAREDDAELAIRAALGMQAAASAAAREHYGSDWEPGDESPIPFLAGVTTGPVLLERESETRSYQASGATITLAGRLKDAAPPGGVLVAHDTFTQVRGVFDFGTHDPLRVRGTRGLLDVYVAQRARPRAFRLQARGIEGVETKMIGREVELRVLQEALTLVLEDSETQVVTVVGDAGVGKSRLLFEFSSWIDLMDERVWFFEARATQPSMLQPYALTRDLFSFRFQILDSDPLDVVHQKFIDGMRGFLGHGCDEQAQLIGQLVGFDFSTHDTVASALKNPERFQKEALKHLGQFFVEASKVSPVLIQIEDIHWADDRSLDLLNNLVRENTQLPLFVICMARPSLFERRPQWGEGQRFHARVALEPLSLLSSRRLVKELLKLCESVPTELRDLVIDRGEGNPFYIEELIKALIDDGVIVKGNESWKVDTTRLSKVRIPTTLTGVLQSRLDTLPGPLQQLLQRASVVGRVFWDSALQHLAEPDRVTPAAVTSMLENLREREMVFLREESSFGKAQEYVFRHAILRDVTYETVVPRTRRAYHRHVAEWLTDAGGERASELTLLVAEHYELAGEPDAAARHLATAAETAKRLSNLEEVFTTLDKALALLADEKHGALRRELLVAKAEAYGLRGLISESEAALEEALSGARQHGEDLTVAKALTHLGRASMWRGDLDHSKVYLDEALPLIRGLDDKPTLVLALRQMGNALSESNPQAAREVLEESIALAREIDDPVSVAVALNSVGIVIGRNGNWTEAQQYFREAADTARAANDRGAMVLYLGNLAECKVDDGDYESARSLLTESVQIARELESESLLAQVLSTDAELQLRLGENAAARHVLEEAWHYCMAVEAPPNHLYYLELVAWHEARAGDPVRACEWLGLVTTHSAVDVEVVDRAGKIKEELAERLDAQQIEAAMKRGETLELADELARVKGLLGISSS